MQEEKKERERERERGEQNSDSLQFNTRTSIQEIKQVHCSKAPIVPFMIAIRRNGYVDVDGGI